MICHKEWFKRPRKRDNPENHLRLQILIYLKSCGLSAGKVKTTGAPRPGGGFIFDPYTWRGLPDIIAFDDDKKIMYAIECKIGDNKQSEYQKAFQQVFHAPPGRIYLVAYSLEEIKQTIK